MADSRLESGLEAYFRKQVRLRGSRTIKLIPTEKGVPDRLVFWHTGDMYLAELKREGEDPSPAQRVWHSRLAALGIAVALLHGRAEVDAWLDSLPH